MKIWFTVSEGAEYAPASAATPSTPRASGASCTTHASAAGDRFDSSLNGSTRGWNDTHGLRSPRVVKQNSVSESR